MWKSVLGYVLTWCTFQNYSTIFNQSFLAIGQSFPSKIPKWKCWEQSPEAAFCFGLGKNLSESSWIYSTVSHSPSSTTMAVIMPLNIHETSHTVLKPWEEHFSNVIGNSYILHTAQAYILFSQFLYFWPNRTESFESRKKKPQYKRLEQLLEGLRFPPPPFCSS